MHANAVPCETENEQELWKLMLRVSANHKRSTTVIQGWKLVKATANQGRSVSEQARSAHCPLQRL